MAQPALAAADKGPVRHIAEKQRASGLATRRMEDLSQVLWHERELLETLLYKLQVERLVLTSDSTRWLSTAVREVEMVLETLRATELLRAVAADAAAASLGMSSNASLRALAQSAGEPWHTILMDHHEALVNLHARSDGHRSLEPGAAHRRSPGDARGVPGTPPRARADHHMTGPEVEYVDFRPATMELALEEVVLEAALGAVSRVVHPSLLDFLR